MNTVMHVLLLSFQNMYYYFWMISWIKKVNKFQIAKDQPQGVAQHLLNFLPISTWRCLKKCYLQKTACTSRKLIFAKIFHCVKSGQIRSFFWSVFSRIRTEYGDSRSEFGHFLHSDLFGGIHYNSMFCNSMFIPKEQKG